MSSKLFLIFWKFTVDSSADCFKINCLCLNKSLHFHLHKSTPSLLNQWLLLCSLQFEPSAAKSMHFQSCDAQNIFSVPRIVWKDWSHQIDKWLFLLCRDIWPNLSLLFLTSLIKLHHHVIDEEAQAVCHHLPAPTCLDTTGDWARVARVASARFKLFMGCRHPPRGERDTNYVL